MEVVVPLLKRAVGSVSATSRFWENYVDLRNTNTENRQLKDQLADQRRRLLSYEEKLRELKRLDVLDELQTQLDLDSVKARIIGGDSTQWFHSRIIDQGARAGVSPDAAVINAEGVVGRVIHVSAHSAVVQLITDLNSGVGVLLENSRAQGVLQGAGSQTAYVRYIGTSDSAVEGERVLTSGLDQIYPKGLLVGYVESWTVENQVFQRIKVALSAEMKKLEEVLVLKKRESDS